MEFLRLHGSRIWTAAILLGLAAATVYVLVITSSEVTRWDRYEVMVVSRDMPPNSKNPTYDYLTVAPDGRKIRFSSYLLLSVGDRVMVEETILQNGHSTFRLIGGGDSPRASR